LKVKFAGRASGFQTGRWGGAKLELAAKVETQTEIWMAAGDEGCARGARIVFALAQLS